MSTQDKCCSLAPYFLINVGKVDKFKALCDKFIKKTQTETKCLYYGFSFDGNEVHCREAYEDADGLLAHLENVADLLDQALDIADIIRLEVHGPEDQINKLRQPLAHLSPQFFQLEYGFRRVPTEKEEFA